MLVLASLVQLCMQQATVPKCQSDVHHLVLAGTKGCSAAATDVASSAHNILNQKFQLSTPLPSGQAGCAYPGGRLRLAGGRLAWPLAWSWASHHALRQKLQLPHSATWPHSEHMKILVHRAC
jgi:hypothetical protein